MTLMCYNALWTSNHLEASSHVHDHHITTLHYIVQKNYLLTLYKQEITCLWHTPSGSSSVCPLLSMGLVLQVHIPPALLICHG